MLERTPLTALTLAALLSAPLATAQDASDPFAEIPDEAPAAVPSPQPASEPAGDADPGEVDDFGAGSEGDVATDADAGGADDFGSELESEYGFDPADEFSSAEEPEDRDPWEGFNRAMFRFNDTADRWFLKPAAVSYRQITPVFMQTGISNFFANMHEVNNVLNNILQWKWGQASNDTGRFLINSTVGVVGLFDVAQHMGLERSDGEDFGQTLAVWGMESGPYLVVPFMGPSTVRDAPAIVVDWYTNPLTYLEDNAVENTLKGIDLIQLRASLLQTESLLQGDRYVLMRDAYLQRREFLINDGEQEDDFGGDLDEYDF
ncbi:VacJ family lipoprotein [Microbulbifer sp. Q7]|uniref:MlaA family lipoprotein n=1 Tax=Microbulbifer sp. Q7 TaxID=1785091 RepID=UPI000AE72AFC|nr:VacJ family lipoprotein [Microbulbifer sp. Q7]